MKRLFRGLLAAPYGTIRNVFFDFAIGCLLVAIWAAITAEWLYLLGFGSGFIVLIVFALIDQHQSEVSGKVERERQRQAEVFATRAAGRRGNVGSSTAHSVRCFSLSASGSWWTDADTPGPGNPR